MTGCQSNAKYNLCDYFSFSDASSFAADLVKKMFPALCPSSFVVPLCLFFTFFSLFTGPYTKYWPYITSSSLLVWLYTTAPNTELDAYPAKWTQICTPHSVFSALSHSFIFSPFSSLSFSFFLSLPSWLLLLVVCSHIAIAVLHLASLCLCQDCFAFVIDSSGRTLLAMCKMCIWVHPVELHFVVHTSWLARSNNLSSHSHYSHKQTHTQCVLQISNLPKPNSTACVFMLLPRLQCQWISGLVCWASSSSSLGVFVVALFATLH